MCKYCDDNTINNLINSFNNSNDILKQLKALDSIEKLSINYEDLYDAYGESRLTVFLMANGCYYFYNYDNDNIHFEYTNSKMYYCPVCGRKLDERVV